MGLDEDLRHGVIVLKGLSLSPVGIINKRATPSRIIFNFILIFIYFLSIDQMFIIQFFKVRIS